MVIVGIDEVGRGCWAGPIVAGAVILPPGFKSPAKTKWLLRDSKVLAKQQREASDLGIREIALSVGLGWVEAATIDKVGITAAVKWAMEQALEQISIFYDQIIIDGHYNFLSGNPKAQTIIKADSLISAVSAASIIAKVARDNYMAKVIEDYPDYGFESHVGYGTALHLERLKLHGVSDIHRRSFKPIQALVQ